MDISDARPRLVRLEEGRPEGQGCWIVAGKSCVVDADCSNRQRGVEYCVVLGIASDSDIWFGAGNGADVVKQILI